MANLGYFGCSFIRPDPHLSYPSRHFLPQVELNAHTVIQSTASRTRLLQTFVNNTSDRTPELQYTFPLYDGVSVVSFKCTIGDKVIIGVVKEKNEARQQYKAAVDRGEAAGLLEQFSEVSDVFSTNLGNVPKNGKAVVEIEYVGELKHDAQSDGIRFTIPTSIAPRYGTVSSDSQSALSSTRGGKIEIAVDIEVDEDSNIEGVSSPSHPIAMTLGKTSNKKDKFRSSCASAALSLGSAELGRDFIIVVNVNEGGIPRALLEEHPDIPNHRALMATLVPKFNLPSIHPEIVFVVDRSGSMQGKIPTLVEALKVFLKSIPLSAKFNICSFGSDYSFLFPKSSPYDQRSLQTALTDVDGFDANYGGTELLRPIQATVENRLKGVPLEIMVLTDGGIWNQQELFDFVNASVKSDVRLFSLGIGTGASTSLVEGLARAGNGFAQFVQDNEKMDKRVVRMLKAALSPHISDYRLDVNYSDESQVGSEEDDDYDMVESTQITEKNTIPIRQKEASPPAPISLFDSNFREAATNPPVGRYDHLPSLKPMKEVQAPNTISGLFPFSRTCAFLLLPNSTKDIRSVFLRGTYHDTPIHLEIPVQKVGTGKTIHQLAAKKAMLEVEEGRGWLSTAKATDGTSLKSKHEADWDRIIEREAVRLGVDFQVAGRYCSFVAVKDDISKKAKLLHVPGDLFEPQIWSNPTMNSFGGGGGDPIMYRSRKFGYRGKLSSAAPSTSLFGSTSNVSVISSSPADYIMLAGSRDSDDKGTDERLVSGRNSSASFATPSRRAYKKKSSGSGGGWGSSLFSGAAFSPLSSFSAAPPPPSTRNDAAPMLFGKARASESQHTVPSQALDTVEAKMHRIIGLQHFDGSWTAGDELFKLTHVWRADFEVADFNYEDESIKATILAIAWLEKEAAKDVEVWEMVVDKAKQWLADKHGITNQEGLVRQAIAIFFP